MHRFVQAVNRCLSIRIGAHFDEAEALAAAGIAVDDHLNVADFAIGTEQLFEVGG